MSVTRTKPKASKSADLTGLSKRKVIRRLCDETPSLRKKTNAEIAAAFKQRTGLDVSHSTILDAVGTYQARIAADNGDVTAVLNRLMELCSYDEKLARSSVEDFLRQYRRLKRKPVVAAG